jgi:lysozyme
MMIICPKVIDIYHGDTVTSFARAYAFGIRGVIHKATQGRAIEDPAYAARRRQALAAGMLWGAYHFNSGEDVPGQVRNFLAAAQPDAKTLLALDFEDNPHSNMSLAQARQWLELVAAATGRYPWIYSGNRIKETIAGAAAADRAFFGRHKLWLAQYSSTPRLLDIDGKPLPWSKATLWQYTGDGVGPRPHAVPGIQDRMDINSYDGTDEQLEDDWPGDPVATAGA